MNVSRKDFIASVAAAGAVASGVRMAKAEDRKDRDAVVYVAAHPDDLAGSIGTVMRLAEISRMMLPPYLVGTL